MLNKLIRYFIDHKLVAALLFLFLFIGGISTAPFKWDSFGMEQYPVPVDAIPDIGENQQIVFTQWAGRSPQDIEDQVTYPLTTSLLGIPGVKTIRSNSIFGFSSIYIIFEEGVEFYWSRSRILEKLNSLPAGLLPEGIQPSLGPDATALGQVFWYTIEGRDSLGQPTGGWDLHEIRSVQDFYVKYALNAVDGVSEVASIGGYVQEYQIDADPDALRVYGISLTQLMVAVKKTNKDIGAKTIEINQAEYLVRGLGYIKSIEDIENTVVYIQDNTPIRIKDVAKVVLGPAARRGVLDKDGAEVVGGVAVARYGSNPLEVIENLKEKIQEIEKGLPSKQLQNGTISKLTIVPFYDRTQLIQETLGTLETALSLEVLVTIFVVIIMVLNLRASVLISSLLPMAVLLVFIAMKFTGVDANIVALSGIAIAIGTMVDLGIVLTENMMQKIKHYPNDIKKAIYEGASEVSGAILTAVATTIVSFVPVFTLQAAEGKLFRPLAFTKSYALIAAVIVALFILPALAQVVFNLKIKKKITKMVFVALGVMVSVVLLFKGFIWAGITLLALSISVLLQYWGADKINWLRNGPMAVVLLSVAWLLSKHWLPLGSFYSVFSNFVFVVVLMGLVLSLFLSLEKFYRQILGWCLAHKQLFLSVPLLLFALGMLCWMGFDGVFGSAFGKLEHTGLDVKKSNFYTNMEAIFPGLGEEFMPALDEGSFLLMPTSMPHAGMEQNKRVVQQLDMLLANIPEVELAVGKMGRVNSALDPAPISMYENIINYKPEYATDQNGRRQRYLVDDSGKFVLKGGAAVSNQEALYQGITKRDLIGNRKGKYFRNWRKEIRSSDDIWDEIVKVTQLPGVTSAPKLQPIETRLVMLQTGMRAPMGIKVFGPNLEAIEAFGKQLEKLLKTLPSVKKEAVFADRIVGKPYIQLNIKRDAIARYGLYIEDVQQTIETAVGGSTVTSTIEGRERFSVRVRYPRELRNSPEKLKNIYIPTPMGAPVLLGDLIDIQYVRGPQVIKSEDTFLVGYVLLDKKQGFSEVEVVESAQKLFNEKIKNGELIVPSGIGYKFSGSYENQVRAEKRLLLIVPVVMAVIFLILYLQFKSISTSLMVFSGILLAFSGAFILLWLYNTTWFMNFEILGIDLRSLFQIKSINLSVAVWVGFIALFGIATDDGVLIGTYLDQSFKKNQPNTLASIRTSVVEAGLRRIKPAIMTSATTIIALMPVLTSTGKGADIMVPMAIPAFGGMVVAAITYFLLPVVYCWREEIKLKRNTINGAS